MKSTRDALRTSAEFMEANGIENAAVEAELLLAHVIGIARDKLIIETLHVDPEIMQKFNRFVSRRAELHEPFAYIVGSAGFMDIEVEVTGSVLIPRPSTETLAEHARKAKGTTVADIGTGSGAISVYLALQQEDRRIVATDVSGNALSVAGRNAKRFGVADRIEFREGADLDPILEPVDLIVTNPPYIPTDILDTLSEEVQREPRLALDGGEDGMDVIRRIIAAAPAKLNADGSLLLEFGIRQEDEVRELAKAAGFKSIQIVKDLDGHERVLLAHMH